MLRGVRYISNDDVLKPFIAIFARWIGTEDPHLTVSVVINDRVSPCEFSMHAYLLIPTSEIEDGYAVADLYDIIWDQSEAAVSPDNSPAGMFTRMAQQSSVTIFYDTLDELLDEIRDEPNLIQRICSIISDFNHSVEKLDGYNPSFSPETEEESLYITRILR